MSDKESNAAEWAQSIRDSLLREGAELDGEVPVYDSVGDMMYGAGDEFFVAVAGNHPVDPENSPVRVVMVVHVRDLISMAEKVLTTLRKEGKLEYLQSLGIPVVDMSDGDEVTPEPKLH